MNNFDEIKRKQIKTIEFTDKKNRKYKVIHSVLVSEKTDEEIISKIKKDLEKIYNFDKTVTK